MLLEKLRSLSLILVELCLGLITQLVVNLNLFTRHLDVFFDYADLLLFFRSLEAEVVVVLISTFLTALGHRGRINWSRRLLHSGHWLIFFELIEHLICLQIDLVLLVELHFEADNVGDRSEHAGVQERLKLGAECALNQTHDCLGCSSLLALCQRLHRAANQDELLLEVVETDDTVDLVPVIDACFERGIRR